MSNIWEVEEHMCLSSVFLFFFFLTLSSLCSLIVCKIAVEARVASYRPGITCSFMDVLLKLPSSHPGVLLWSQLGLLWGLMPIHIHYLPVRYKDQLSFLMNFDSLFKCILVFPTIPTWLAPLSSTSFHCS